MFRGLPGYFRCAAYALFSARSVPKVFSPKKYDSNTDKLAGSNRRNLTDEGRATGSCRQKKRNTKKCSVLYSALYIIMCILIIGLFIVRAVQAPAQAHLQREAQRVVVACRRQTAAVGQVVGEPRLDEESHVRQESAVCAGAERE